MMSQPTSRRRVLAFCLAIGAALGGGNAGASEVNDGFYKGKTVTLVVAAPPGGGYDLSARLLARYMGRYIPGEPSVVVQNMPGAGGFRTAAYMHNAAPRDGTVIALHTRGIIQAPMLGDPAARYDSLDFSWVGTLSSSKDDAYLLMVNKSSGVRTIEDMRRASPTVTLGSVGGVTTNVIFALLSPHLFNFNTRLIKGYAGSAEVMLAVQRGEVNGAYVGLSSLTGSFEDAMKSGALLPILQVARLERHPSYPDVPTAQELTRQADPKTKALLSFVESVFLVALPVSGPPGLPKDRLRTLRTALMKATVDPDFLVDAKKIGLDPSSLDGAAMEKIITDMKATPPDVIELYKKLLEDTK